MSPGARRPQRAVRRRALADRAFGLLLLAYPRSFRLEYGSEMRRVFADLWRERAAGQGAGAVARLLAWLLGDVVRSAARERMAEVAGAQRGASAPEPGRPPYGTGRKVMEMFAAAAWTVRLAARNVLRARRLSASVLLLLALGIGANVTMFSTVDRMVLSAPNHVHDPAQVKRVWVERFAQADGRWRVALFSYADFADLSAAEGLPDFAAYTPAAEFLGEGLDARRVTGWAVTGNFWELLGVRPHVGRFFTEEDDQPAGEPVVVLSFGLWTRDFGGDPALIGRTVRIGMLSYTVVGVAPPGFTGAELGSADVWLPFHHRYHQVYAPFSGGAALGRGLRLVFPVVRVPPDVSPERVAEQARAAYLAGRQELIESGRDEADQRIVLGGLAGPAPVAGASAGVPDRDGRVALWLAGVSLLVLLIACANTANLLLGRAIRQRRETAIRLALGASRLRLVGQTAAEGMLLAAAGGALALALTHQLGGALQRTLLPDVEWGLPVTGRLVLFVGAVALGAGLLSAVIPAVQAGRYAVVGPIRAASGGTGGSRGRLRGWLVVTQAAVSVVLLVGAGLFVRSLGRAQATELGFEAERVLGVEPWFVEGSTLDPSTPESRAFAERAREHLQTLSGIEAVAWGGDGAPFAGGSTPRLAASGNDSLALPGGGPYLFRVEADWFRVLGQDVVEGRALDASDRADTEPVAVVSHSMARHLWPVEGALGRCLFVGGSDVCARVVGVVSDIKVRAIGETASFAYFLPLEQRPSTSGLLMVRTHDAAGPMIDPIKRELTALDERVRYVRVVSLAGDVISPQFRSWRLGATVFSAFGLLAMAVAALGLYAVLAFEVEQRRREIALRSALGASREGVVRLFVTRAVRLTALGTAGGLAMAFLLAPRLEDLLFETSAHDPLTFGGIAMALIATGLLAGGLPAWRAACLDPNVVLREE